MSSKQDPRILRVNGEPGDWFVDLRAGYALLDANTPSAQHGFGEDRKGDIGRTMRRVTPCSCAECTELLAAGRDE